MSTFIPSSNLIVWISVAALFSVIIMGFGITRITNFRIAVFFSWLLVGLGIILIERATINEAAGFRMLALIMVTLFAMKVPVTVEAYKGSRVKLTFIQWTCFVAGWFGMRPKLFEKFGSHPLPGVGPLLRIGVSRILLGTLLLFSAKLISIYFTNSYSVLLYSAALLIGLSLILHFGILNISAAMWRQSGVDTKTLFRSPMKSASLTEFWGRRWNLAFSEMTSLAVYRPLSSTIGAQPAMVVAFLFSGLFHELALSVPVKTGYGLPMLYFVIQAMAMMFEKLLAKSGFVFSDTKIIGRIWVFFWLLLPMPLLFHKVFMNEVVLPIIGL